MKNVKFSIIIPVYNTGMYLDKCLSSIINQTYCNFEVILINDGSTDNSLEICNKFALIDSRIKVISLSNHGVSYARNIGLNKATGNYITFLDSDDWLDSNTLFIVKEKIDIDNYDIIQCNLFLDFPKHSILYKEISNDIIVTNKYEIISSILSIKYSEKKYHKKYLNPRCAGGKFYSANLIRNNNISFPVGIASVEDGIFNLTAYEKANKILILKNAYYHYVQYMGSATEKFNSNQGNQNIMILSKIKKILSTNYQEYCEVYNYLVFELYYVWIDKLVRLDNSKSIIKKIQELKRISLLPTYKNAIQNVNKKDLTKLYYIVLLLTKYHLYIMIYVLFKIKSIIKKIRRG